MLAGARLSEEGLIRTAIKDVLCVGVGATISSETVLEKVPNVVVSRESEEVRYNEVEW